METSTGGIDDRGSERLTLVHEPGDNMARLPAGEFTIHAGSGLSSPPDGGGGGFHDHRLAETWQGCPGKNAHTPIKIQQPSGSGRHQPVQCISVNLLRSPGMGLDKHVRRQRHGHSHQLLGGQPPGLERMHPPGSTEKNLQVRVGSGQAGQGRPQARRRAGIAKDRGHHSFFGSGITQIQPHARSHPAARFGPGCQRRPQTVDASQEPGHGQVAFLKIHQRPATPIHPHYHPALIYQSPQHHPPAVTVFRAHGHHLVDPNSLDSRCPAQEFTDAPPLETTLCRGIHHLQRAATTDAKMDAPGLPPLRRGIKRLLQHRFHVIPVVANDSGPNPLTGNRIRHHDHQAIMPAPHPLTAGTQVVDGQRHHLSQPGQCRGSLRRAFFHALSLFAGAGSDTCRRYNPSVNVLRPDIEPMPPPGPDRDPQGVQRMFTSIAPRYDRANRLLSMGTDRYWRWVTARRLAPATGERALDVACGTGDLAFALRRRGGQVVGVDFTHAMLKHARLRDPRADIAFAGGDALQLPFADGTFHRLTVSFGVRNFADLRAGLREFHRVLKPGGMVGILEFSRPRGPLAPFARLYLRHIMPPLGRLISGRDGPYDYLADSIRTWPPPRELGEMLTAAGFSSIRWRRFMSGIAALHTAVRP